MELAVYHQQNVALGGIRHCGTKPGNLSCGKVRGTLRTKLKRDGLKPLSLCLASSYAKQELIKDMLRI